MPISAQSHKLYDRPWLLLALCALFWAGNAVAGKLAIGQISPMTLTCARWTCACLLLAMIMPRRLAADFIIIRPRLPFVLAMGMLGFTGFNAFLYLAALHTNGVNLLIIQGAIPVLILVAAGLLRHERVGHLQIMGVGLTMVGVAVTATQGHLERLLDLKLNIGDLMMLGASLCYALYALLLRRRPPVSGLSLLFYLSIGGALSAGLALLVEINQGASFFPTPKGLAILAYCILFPSILSQVFFLRGVELIGAARAGLCVNLIPVFGALLMVLAGEPFLWSHAVALILVLSGVAVAEQAKQR